MSDEKPNGVATVEDFRRAAYERADREFGEPERVILPGSRLAVLLRRPRAGYFVVRGLPLPQSVAAKSDGEAARELTADESRDLATRVADLLEHAMVSPKLSILPGADAISPNWLLDQDMEFLFRYLLGEVLPGGQDLAGFRETREPASPTGAAGGDVALPTE